MDYLNFQFKVPIGIPTARDKVKVGTVGVDFWKTLFSSSPLPRPPSTSHFPPA